MKGDGSALDVAHAQATELERAADARPVDKAAAGASLFTTMPQEISDQTIGKLEDRGREGHSEKQVKWHGREDVADEGDTLAAGEEECLSGAQALGHLLDKRHERRSTNFPRREGKA